MVGVASALYIIPSLALFAILGPITGYVASYPTAEIALVGYTLLILIWNTMAGLDAVPADAREAATAMGYSPTAAPGPGRSAPGPALRLRRAAGRRRRPSSAW